MIYYFLNRLNHWKRFPYFFVTPLVYAIGSACEEINIAYSFSKKTNKKIFVLNVYFFQKILKYRVCNNSLFEDLKFEDYTKLEKSIKYAVNFLLNIEFIFRRFFVLILKNFYRGDLSKYNFPIIGFEQMINIDKKKLNPKKNIFIDYSQIKKINFIKNNIDLETIKNQYCINKLNFLNIPFDRLVLLHVRDEKYRNDKDRRSYRNSNINSYIESIKHLINQNYFVIRVGRYPSKEILFKDKNFFDYATSNIQEDILDIFLMKNCKYFIGTQSGIFDMAQLFNKPILVTNMVELFCSYPLKINDRGIFKKIYHRGRQLNIADYIKYDFEYHNPTNHIKDLSFEDNSDEEIYYSLTEFLDAQKIPALSKIQKNFNKFLLNEHMNHYEKSPKKLFTIYSSYKVVRLVKDKQGCLTNVNLKKLSFN